MIKSEVKKPLETPQLANFEQTALEWAKKQFGIDAEVGRTNSVLDFARYLDSFKSLDSKLQILALQKTLETYIEFYQIVKEKVDPVILDKCMAELKKKHPSRK